MMVVLVPSRVCAGVRHRPNPGAQHSQPDGDDEQGRGEVQPGIQVGRHDELGQRERHDPEREDADRVRDGDDQPEEDRVPRGSP
jgi:hypothetical protein